MGFIKAFSGAIGGAFADQWKDFYKPMPGVPETAALIEDLIQKDQIILLLMVVRLLYQKDVL